MAVSEHSHEGCIMPEDMEKEYSIKFDQEDTAELKDMAKEAGLTVARLIRHAINFYQIHIDAKKEDKNIILEDKDGKREWVPI